MRRASYLSAVEREAAALRGVASTRDLATAVPACPGWDLERLVGHIGRVHRWSAGWAAAGAAPSVERPPGGPDVVAWSAAGTQELVAALAEGDDDAIGPTWAGDRPGIFWPRRMAIETALHRWDAEAAVGAPAPIHAELAVEAIDELFDVLVPERAAGALAGAGETLHLHATDVAGEWLITLTAEGPHVERSHAKGDVAARGTASDLLLFLWNRVGADRLTVFGDAALLDRWTTSVTF
ncbi:MAG TPA: maleylpyruvate isomerase family mycothiol-dependent enzyme [Acidimicrobiales bacterium]|nr:maleylpyruvate isomerase family mycothiol-dependent enzyme [Acidimicrobiales bacterium]